MNISLSILNSNNVPKYLKNMCMIYKSLNEKYSKSQNLFDISAHFDIMDSKFVSQKGISMKYILVAKKLGYYIDVHLMVQKPIEDKYIDDAIKYGADNITIHYEIENFEKVLDYLSKKNISVTIAIKPNTDYKLLLKYKGKFSKILIMSVEPGLGKQEYIAATDEKIEKLKEIFPNCDIQIDGGINDITICKPLELKVNNYVIGSYLTSDEDDYNALFDKLFRLNILKNIWSIDKNRNVEFDKKLLQITDGGYGYGDKLIGLNVPTIRKYANSLYKDMSINNLSFFITKNYHEYRQFVIFCMSYLVKKYLKENQTDNLNKLYLFFKDNLQYINNWDLTDEAGPNILGYYLLQYDENTINKELYFYLSSNNFWIKRIGIVSMLTFTQNNNIELPLKVCKHMLYCDNVMLQKATGWVLREIYKKDNKYIVNFLRTNQLIKNIPSITLNYACEKMSAEEKKYIKFIEKR